MNAFLYTVVEDALVDLVRYPIEGRHYCTTTWTVERPLHCYFTTKSNTFSYVGKHLRDETDPYGDYWSIFLNTQGDEVQVIQQAEFKTAFYAVQTVAEGMELPQATKLEVIRHAQEGRYYYTTNFTEKIGEFPGERYFTTQPLTYVGRYTGSRSEGWGKKMEEWSHFINDQGQEIILKHRLTTAFYQMVPPHIPTIAPRGKQDGHRIQTDTVVNAQKKEVFVVRTPIEGKYYEATFWTRREGHWSAEKHYTAASNPREYVGKYLRHKQIGYGDGADHWAIFWRDDKEIEIEYDYDGKRAWYEVEAQRS